MGLIGLNKSQCLGLIGSDERHHLNSLASLCEILENCKKEKKTKKCGSHCAASGLFYNAEIISKFEKSRLPDGRSHQLVHTQSPGFDCKLCKLDVVNILRKVRSSRSPWAIGDRALKEKKLDCLRPD